MRSNNIKAKISWNRLTGEYKYQSLNETPKLKAVFTKQKNKFVCIELVVKDTGYSAKDLQNKLQKIAQHLQLKYESVIM